MPAMPATIEVGPFAYTVLVDPTAMRDHEHAAHHTCMGGLDTKGLRIMLAPEQAAGQMRDTLLHEVLHACFNVTGGLPTYDEEEKVLSLLASLLLDTLRRNPEFVAYLVGGE